MFAQEPDGAVESSSASCGKFLQRSPGLCATLWTDRAPRFIMVPMGRALAVAFALLGVGFAGRSVDARLPLLPVQGLLLARSHSVEFLSLSGRRLGSLEGFTLAGDPYPGGALRDRRGRTWRIDVHTRRLVRVRPRAVRPPLPHTCTPASSPTLLLCLTGASKEPNTVTSRDGRLVQGVPPGVRIVAGTPSGYWRDAWLSPDRRTVLAQWSGECEAPTAFLFGRGIKRARPVGGGTSVANSPGSIGLGWTRSGRAIVSIPWGGCSNDFARPGVYLVSPSGRALLRIVAFPRKSPALVNVGAWGVSS